VDRVSIERVCAGKEFQVEGIDTEKAQEEKLLVIPGSVVRRFVLEDVICAFPVLKSSAEAPIRRRGKLYYF